MIELVGLQFYHVNKNCIVFFSQYNGKVNLKQFIMPRENNVVKDIVNGSVFPIARMIQKFKDDIGTRTMTFLCMYVEFIET